MNDTEQLDAGGLSNLTKWFNLGKNILIWKPMKNWLSNVKAVLPKNVPLIEKNTKIIFFEKNGKKINFKIKGDIFLIKLIEHLRFSFSWAFEWVYLRPG
jgi:hypothetical protein